MDMLIYVHIPKTAGTSLRHILEEYAEKDGVFAAYPGERSAYRSVHDWARLSNEEKGRIRVVVGHYHFAAFNRYIDAKEKRFMTFLRDPVARVISLYKHTMRASSAYCASPVSLLKFCSESTRDILVQIDNHQTRMIAGVTDDAQVTKDDLAKAKSIIDRMFFFVGTTENFANDVERLSRCLDFPLDATKVENASDDRTQQEFYSGMELDFIKRANQFDIELYRHVVAKRRHQQDLAPEPKG